jgi:hypothetical protein
MSDIGRDAALKELQVVRSYRLGPVSFHGNSMRPFIEDGDELVVAPIPWESIRVGDIVTYRLEAMFPTCRVVARSADELLLRADNWPRSRYRIRREDVLGRVVSRRRAGRALHHSDWRWRLTSARVLVREGVRGALSSLEGRVRHARVPSNVWRRWRHGRDAPAGLRLHLAAQDGTRLMRRETFEALLPELGILPALHISRPGEPLLHPDLPAWLAALNARHPRLAVSMSTDAVHLDEAAARVLVEHRLDVLHVRLDALQTAAAIGVGEDGSGDTGVARNLRRLTALRQAHGRRRPVVVVSCEPSHGRPALADVLRFARQAGIHAIRLAPTAASAWGVSADGPPLRHAIKLAEAFGIGLERPGPPAGTCFHPRAPHVAEDGSVHPTGFGNADSAVGNVGREAFGQIWKAPAYRELRRQAAAGGDPDECPATR